MIEVIDQTARNVLKWLHDHWYYVVLFVFSVALGWAWGSQ